MVASSSHNALEKMSKLLFPNDTHSQKQCIDSVWNALDHEPVYGDSPPDRVKRLYDTTATRPLEEALRHIGGGEG